VTLGSALRLPKIMFATATKKEIRGKKKSLKLRNFDMCRWLSAPSSHALSSSLLLLLCNFAKLAASAEATRVDVVRAEVLALAPAPSICC